MQHALGEVQWLHIRSWFETLTGSVISQRIPMNPGRHLRKGAGWWVRVDEHSKKLTLNKEHNV